MIQKIKDINKKLSEALDLKKRMPGYFNQWIFRIAVLIIVIFFFIAWGMDDWRINNFYIKCPDNAMRGHCENPIYVCQGPDPQIHMTCLLPYNIPDYIKPLCEEGLCDNRTIPAGQSIGMKYNPLVKNFVNISLAVCLFAFIINHILYIKKFKQDLIRRQNK